MICYFDTKEEAAGFAEEVNRVFGPNSASITTTAREKYAVCYAPSATASSSDDTEPLTASGFFKTQANI